MNKILKVAVALFTKAKDYLPFVRTTVSSALTVFDKVHADLEKVKAHHISMAGIAKDAEIAALSVIDKAKADRVAAETEIKAAVATARKLREFLGK